MSVEFDRDAFDAVTAGDAEIAGELADLFKTDSARLLGELESSISSRDEEVVRRTAHTLKSSAGSLGAMKASEIAASIEHGGMESAVEMLTPLKAAVQAGVEGMSSTVAELSGA